MQKINNKVAVIWTPDKITSEIPESLSVSSVCYDSPVRNTRWPYLYFKDSSVFTPAANAFNQSSKTQPRYTPHIKGTTAYKNFWRLQRKRCLEGYEPEVDGKPCGVRITGEYYFYLNFCRIQIAGVDEYTKEDIEVTSFPRFCSMDYYWFTELESRENPAKYNLPKSNKRHLILAKSRRKGWSFKNAAGAVWKFSFFPKVKIAIISQEGTKAAETFEKCLNMIDFLTTYTEFGGPSIHRTFNRKKGGNIVAGVQDKLTRASKGRRSEIYTVSLHNKPDAASGAGCVRVIFEEAGMIKDLKQAWSYTEPTMRSGKILKGIATIYGTGGDMENGSDFAEMFYNPMGHKLAAFDNIYEDSAVSGKCGLYVCDMWFREGATYTDSQGKTHQALDENGNARFWVAEHDLDLERLETKTADKETYDKNMTQFSKFPSETFLIPSKNIFPSAELRDVLSQVLSNQTDKLIAVKGELVQGTQKNPYNGVAFVPDMDNRLHAIDDFPVKSNLKNKEGCVLQYEPPRLINGAVLSGAYIVTMDTIGIEESGTSYVSIMVIKTKKYAHLIGYDEIVMDYLGRPKENAMDETSYIAYKMCLYYNAKLTHETDRAGKVVRDFFIKNKAFHMLLKPPASIVEKHLPNSKSLLRKTGHSFGSSELKEIGEIYLNRWLRQKRGVNMVTGNEERNLHMLKNIGLIKELISYQRGSDAFHRVMALMGGVLQLAHTHNEFLQAESQVSPVSRVVNYFNNRKDLSPQDLYALKMKQKREHNIISKSTPSL